VVNDHMAHQSRSLCITNRPGFSRFGVLYRGSGGQRPLERASGALLVPATRRSQTAVVCSLCLVNAWRRGRTAAMWRAGVEGAGLAIIAAVGADAVVRRGTRADALAAAEVWLRSRKAAMPAIPAPVHTDDDVRHHFRTIVVTERELWVAVDDVSADVTGLLVLADADVDQLYVDPGWWGRGIGSQLLEQAKRLRPNGLWLWTFQANTGARRFYERHGFVAVDATDGSGNEERAPDVRYAWRP
jgi:GNAT superfamily N-acetyltransferase